MILRCCRPEPVVLVPFPFRPTFETDHDPSSHPSRAGAVQRAAFHPAHP